MDQLEAIVAAFKTRDFPTLDLLLNAHNQYLDLIHANSIGELSLESPDRISLLFIASSQNDLEMMRFLLARGANASLGAAKKIPKPVYNINLVSVPPICVAIEKNFTEAAKLLIDHQADLDVPMFLTRYYQLAVYEGQFIEIIHHLIFDDKKDLRHHALRRLVAQPDVIKESIIFPLIKQNDVESLAIVYQQKPRQNGLSNHPQAVQIATELANAQTLKFILDNDSTIPNENMERALKIAVTLDDRPKIDILFEHGAYTPKTADDFSFIDWCFDTKILLGLPYIIKKHAESLDDAEFDKLFVEIDKRIRQSYQNDQLSGRIYTKSLFTILELKRPISKLFKDSIISMTHKALANGFDFVLEIICQSTYPHYCSVFQEHTATDESPSLAEALSRAPDNSKTSQIIKYLLKIGSNLNKRDAKQKNAIDYAFDNKNKSVSQALLQYNIELKPGLSALRNYISQIPELTQAILDSPNQPYTTVELTRLILEPTTTYDTAKICLRTLFSEKAPELSIAKNKFEALGTLSQCIRKFTKEKMSFTFPPKYYTLLDPIFDKLSLECDLSFQIDTVQFNNSLLSFLQNDRMDFDHLTFMIMQSADNLLTNTKLLYLQLYKARFDPVTQKFIRFEANYLNFLESHKIQDLIKTLEIKFHQVSKSLQDLEQSIADLDRAPELKERRRKQLLDDREKTKKINYEMRRFIDTQALRMSDVDRQLQLLDKRLPSIKPYFMESRFKALAQANHRLALLEEPYFAIESHYEDMIQFSQQLDLWFKSLNAQLDKNRKELNHVARSSRELQKTQASDEAARLLDQLEKRLERMTLDYERATEKRKQDQAARHASPIKVSPTSAPTKCAKLIPTIPSAVSYTSFLAPKATNIHDRLELSHRLTLDRNYGPHQLVIECPFPQDAFHQRLEQNSLLGSLARLLEQLKHFKSPYLNSNAAREARNRIYHSDWSAGLSGTQKGRLRQLATTLSKQCRAIQNGVYHAFDYAFSADNFSEAFSESSSETLARQMAVSWQDWVDITSLTTAPEVPESVVALAKSFIIARLSTCAQKIRNELPDIWAEYKPHHAQLLLLIGTGNRLRHGAQF